MGADIAAPRDIGFDAAYELAGVAVELAQLVANRCRGFTGLPGKAADFIGNDREALRRCAAPRRFDRRIDAKQARLARYSAQFFRNAAHRFDDIEKLPQMAFQPGDIIDQFSDLPQRKGDRIMPFGDDLARAAGGEAEFLSGENAFILTDRQRLHIRLQFAQAHGIGLNPAGQFAKETRSLAALQRNIAGSVSQIGQ